MDEHHVPSSHEPLGQYRLIAEIGRGGMARVYLAVAPGLAGFNKLLVIKQIEKHCAEDPEFLAMFLDEARLAARLSHANIVQTYQIGAEGDQYFIAMEYLEGQSLHQVLRRLRRTTMPLGLQLRVLIDTLAGLEYAHNLADYDGTPLQVVHRDISPQNVFVTYDGRVKIVDFGIAKALGSSSETQNGVIKGKLAYMSPEQARCEKVDRRSDVFSVGVMLWEAATQHMMWRGMSDIEVLRRLQVGDIPALQPMQAPQTAQTTLPPQFEAVCRKALAPNREDRYASAAELQAALEGLLEAMQDKAPLRELGKLVTQAFEPERAKVQAVVENHFRGFTSPSGRYLNPPPFEDGGAGPLSRPSSQSGRLYATPLRTGPIEIDATLPRLQGADALRSASDSASGRRSDLATSIPSSQAPARAPSRAAWLVGIFLVGSIVVGFAGAAILFTRSREPATDAGAGAPAPSAASAAKSAVLTLNSKPAGALVNEGGQSLGTTPLTLPLAADQRGARQFVVTLDGYLPHTVDQAPSRDDVTVTATLTPQPIASQRPRSASGAPGRRSAASTATPVPVGERPPPAASAAPGSITLRTTR